ncbi:uncharacterized protein LOC135390048 [Ornithodoros turicata]|uniref:uncharacterized protein LOC135390048 n=1 Tax=Ornithodoros turicata TaxID=34597 RepID=UPI003138E624
MRWNDLLGASLPSNLCSFVFYGMKYPGGADEIFEGYVDPGSPFDNFQRFIDQIRRPDLNLGIVVPYMIAESLEPRLRQQEGREAFNRYWDKGFKNYAVLDIDVTPFSFESYFTDMKSFISAVRSMQSRPLTTFFIGLKLNFVIDSIGSSEISVAQSLINDIKPDGVLFLPTFRTLFSRSNCRLTGSSVWKNSPIVDQPTFEHSLQLMLYLTFPPNTIKLLSFSMAGRSSQVKWKKAWDLRSKCSWTTMSTPSSYVCPGGADYKDFKGNKPSPNRKLNKEWMEYMVKHGERLHIYEWDDSMINKICWAYKLYGFQDGWVFFDFTHDAMNSCARRGAQHYGSILNVKDHLRSRKALCKNVQLPSP